VSRSHEFAYRVRLSDLGSTHDEAWDRVEAAMHPRWPSATCVGGYSRWGEGVDELEVWFYCNKTKACRIADWLNSQLGVPSTLVQKEN
jgi:hypothetical protein